ncbi:hypothetical protein B566_EDAN004976, partial [Ephemera danica]
MAAKLFHLLLLIVAVYAQEHTTVHPNTREIVDIGGKQYWFTNDIVGAEWIGADFACKNQSMVLTSLETPQEYDDVVAWLRNNMKSGFWWTSGEFVSAEWQWGTGVQVSARNWAGNEPNGSPATWLLEHIAIRVIDGSMYAEPNTNTHAAIC